MKQQVVKILKISGIFVGGIIIGAVLMNLLHMHVRSTYRETIRIDLKTEQEFLASRAARQHDDFKAASHRWNVVDSSSEEGFRAFRKERNKENDSSFFLPFYMVVLKAMGSPMEKAKKDPRRIIEGIDRGKLAVGLESIGENQEAAKQWEIARILTSQKSVEDTRKLVLRFLEHEKTDSYLQAERAVLDDTNEAQSNQPDRE
jgi:hypothetical protein